MLTMRLLAYTVKPVAFNNTLETFTFCSTNYFNFIAFSENVNSNSITNIFFERRIAELFCESFSLIAGFF